MMNIKDLLTEGINDNGIFKAVFVIGIPGAGKSTTISKVTGGDISPRLVNTDTYIEYLSKLHDVKLDGEPGSYILDKSKRLNENQLYLYLNGMLPLIIDGTSSDPEAIRRRQKLLENIGYDTAAVWINTNLQTAWRRIQQRERKVTREFVESVFKTDIEHKKRLKPLFHNFTQIDNDDGMLTDEVILAAYRKMSKFFSAEVANHIGKDHIVNMHRDNQKYLVPKYYDENKLKSVAKQWYVR